MKKALVFKRIIHGNKGFTLIELLVTLFIIAFVLGSIVSVNITSINTRTASEKLTRADAAAQKFTENLYKKPYADVLSLQGMKQSYEGFYLDFKLKPAGNRESATDTALTYVHIVFTQSGCIMVCPDGKYAVTSTAPYNIYYNATSTTYTLTYDGVSITGTKPSVKTIAVINAMQKLSDTTSITIGSSVDAVYYCKSSNESTVAITGGTVTRYKDVNKADKLLVRTLIDVYKDQAGNDRYTSIEGMIQLGL